MFEQFVLAARWAEVERLGQANGLGHHGVGQGVERVVAQLAQHLCDLIIVGADVAVDEEFIERNGTEWRDVLDLALGSANSVLKEVGVRIEMVSVSTWESDDDQAHMSRILDGVLAVTPRGTGRLLLAVTCQDSDRFDGIARDSEAAVVVRYNHDNWRYTGSLIAHEIAHLLGAAHHPEDEECESDGCVMEPAGYADVTEWCDDHREDIRAYLARAA